MNHTLRMLEHRAQERAAASAAVRPSLPPIKVPATVIDPEEPWVPGGARRIARLATVAGLQSSTTVACGPWLDSRGGVTHPEQYSVVVAVQSRDGRRLAFHWRRLDTLVTAEDGTQSWASKWSAEDAQDGRTGRIMKITEAEGEMKSWG